MVTYTHTFIIFLLMAMQGYILHVLGRKSLYMIDTKYVLMVSL